MTTDDAQERLAHVAELEKLSDTLGDRAGGALFQRDLEEAREMAKTDRRFETLVNGLEAESLGDRMAAVNRFFRSIGRVELAALQLPQHLGQLRAIFLRSL